MFKWLTNRLVKSSSNSVLRQFILDGQSTWTDRNYQALSREGYCKNIIAYKCINAIATAASDIPLTIKVNGKEYEQETADKNTNRIANLILRPNRRQNYKTFMNYAIAYRLISGNTYLLKTKGVASNKALELELLRPDKVTIQCDTYNVPSSYIYDMNGVLQNYPIDQITLLSDVLQIKTFNPLDDLYGLSPLSAAMMSVDQHNEAAKWNKKLLENASRPSGIISMKDRGDNAPQLSLEQLQDFSRLVEDKFSGPNNAGKIPIFNHDMQWQALSFSPNDMDWLNGKNSSARDICLAFGYPAFLLGLPDSNSTYNNVEQAKLSLYEDTIIPLLNCMLYEIANWLSQSEGVTIELDPDLDGVPALSPRREIARNNARLDVAGGIITINEAREEIGYEEVDGGDELFVPAGKLPLSFDVTGLTEEKYIDYLVHEIGYTKEQAQHYASLAYKGK